MIADGRSVPSGSVVEADICVIGGGPAGISLALEFAGKAGVTVALVESGGSKWDGRTQELSKATSIGQEYFPVKETHLRVLGGTTLSYGGICTELSPLDFEVRSWVPESGWPITKDALDSHLPRAHELLNVATGTESTPDSQGAEGTSWKTVRISRPLVRFGERYASELENAANIEVCLHSTATKLELHPDGRHIGGVTISCIGGNRYRMVAKYYVLAGGGIEIPRLMLASNDVATAGIGNGGDNVGRYFQEHPRVFDRYRIPSGNTALSERIAGIAGTLTFSRLAVSPKTQRDEKLLDYHANLSFGFSGQDTPQWDAIRRVVVALRAPWRDSPYNHVIGSGPNKVRWEDVKTSMIRPDRTLKSLFALKGLLPRSMHRWVEVASSVEQAPRRENYVTLATAPDELGMPRIELHWSLDDLEGRTYYRGRELVLEELDRLLPGLSNNRMDDAEQWPDHVIGTWHHAGTTRMHADPKSGVVDADSKVHGIDNLFVASSSVFPTSGSTAPTLSIVCLALRLAEHIKMLLRF